MARTVKKTPPKAKPKSKGGRPAINGLGYDAAGVGRRSRGWLASTLGPNTILSQDADKLRQRSHDLMRQNPWAHSAVESFVANSIGTGIKPQCRAKDIDFRKMVHELWSDWTLEADADGVTDFYGQQTMIGRAVLEGGDAFVRIRNRYPEDGLTVPMQLQALEAEHVPITKNETAPNGNVIKCGIEFNGIGQRVAYHMFRSHPGEMLLTQGYLDTSLTVRVPAENVLHIYTPQRIGQIRGEPWLARVLIRLYELDQFDDAELVKQKVAALFAGFIEQAAPTDSLGLNQTDTDETGQAIAGLEPGVLIPLGPGQKMSFADPPQIGGQDSFMKHQLRGAAAGISVPVANMTGDLSEANYSSLRSGTLEFKRRCQKFLSTMIFQLCRPVWNAWLSAAVMNGRLPYDYLKDPVGYGRSKWIGQGWAWVDPLKDVEASKESVRCGFTSRSAVITELGDDPETVDAEIAADQEREARLGIVFDTNSTTTKGNGASELPAEQDPAYHPTKEGKPSYGY